MAVRVDVRVLVRVGVRVAVAAGPVGVFVGVRVEVRVAVRVAVAAGPVGVFVGVRVAVGEPPGDAGRRTKALKSGPVGLGATTPTGAATESPVMGKESEPPE